MRNGKVQLGRRSGQSDTKQRILAASRAEFASNGYAGTSIRSIAKSAGVDPALVMRFYKSKEKLFAASLSLSDELQQSIALLLKGPPETLGTNLTLEILDLWEEGIDVDPLVATLCAASSNHLAAENMAQFIDIISSRLSKHSGAATAKQKQKAEILVSMILGIVFVRKVTRSSYASTMDRRDIALLVGPVLQGILDSMRPEA